MKNFKNKLNKHNLVILMQVTIGTNEKIIFNKISEVCSKLRLYKYIPISRTDTDSRIDCYIFDCSISDEELLKLWKIAFIGVAISIESFNDKFSFYIEKAAEIFQYIRENSKSDIEEHIRRHLNHYIFNAIGYNYLDETKFYLDSSERFLKLLNINIRNR